MRGRCEDRKTKTNAGLRSEDLREPSDLDRSADLVEDEEPPVVVPLHLRAEPDVVEFALRTAPAEVEEAAVAVGVLPELTRSRERHVFIESRPREGATEVDELLWTSEDLVVLLRPKLDGLLAHHLLEILNPTRNDLLSLPFVRELLVGGVVRGPSNRVGVLHRNLRGNGLVVVSLPPERAGDEIEGRDSRTSKGIHESIDTALEPLLALVGDESVDLLVGHATSEESIGNASGERHDPPGSRDDRGRSVLGHFSFLFLVCSPPFRASSSPVLVDKLIIKNDSSYYAPNFLKCQ